MNNLCNECPRGCNVDRQVTVGYCRVNNKIRLARAALHMWEEPCISGDEGSGAVFFSGCNLRCVYCQNHNISNGVVGREITIERLAEIFLELQSKGANNINLVTPSHYVDGIVKAIRLAKGKVCGVESCAGERNGVEVRNIVEVESCAGERSGVEDRNSVEAESCAGERIVVDVEKNIELGREILRIPIVYNSSSYELPTTLKKLEGLVDVYLPDCKYYSDELAMRYSVAPSYHDISIKAIKEMYRQVGKPEFNDKGIMTKGVIVRHLVLPGNVADSKAVIKSLWDEFHNDIYYSIMNQYTPITSIISDRSSKMTCSDVNVGDGILKINDNDVNVGDKSLTPFDFASKYPELTRVVTNEEYDEVLDYALDLGIENGFMQEGEAQSESFIPEFDLTGV